MAASTAKHELRIVARKVNTDLVRMTGKLTALVAELEAALDAGDEEEGSSDGDH